MVPYTYYRLCESYREADGKVKQRTVLGLGELTDFPNESQKRELAEQLTSLINEGESRICFNQKVHDAALVFYGKWLDEKKEAQDRADKLAEEARRKAEEANEVKGEHKAEEPASGDVPRRRSRVHLLRHGKASGGKGIPRRMRLEQGEG